MIFNFNRIIDIKKSMMDSLICAICSNKTGNSLYTASEKQLGFHDEFLYFKCSACGCLQIAEVPKNLSKYYPENYYSYSIPSQNLFEKLKFAIVKKNLLKYRLYRWSLSGYLFSKRYNYYAWMLRGMCNYNSKILDIGCGCGNLLLEMNKLGFKNLKGIDPYIQKDIIYTNGVTVLKKSVEDIDDKYDLIMLHHSFEHMQNSKEVLQKIHGCLNQNCFVLINIPVVSSYAFRKYEVNWAQLDAPRHLFLHTPASICQLAKDTNFKLHATIYNSIYFQFTGSENYLNNRTLHDNGFSRKQMKSFKKESKHLNSINDGDTACFYLKKL